ncbi:LacI family DNA-binding transcriptional regulator [Streptomyces sp. NPDC001698]|uniref:LacI family DNA-binding transcriptional regulator n=1 Tax=Streptomyces sp. NPDC001698 TaxID=3364601 RepID=UPI00369116F1
MQIAREAGVAQSTVSRVLNGGSVAPETRRRVLEVVAKYDFQPSQAARSLVGSRSGLIGVVIRDLTNPFYPVMVKAMERVLHERGLRLSLVTDVMSAEEGLALLRREGVDGVVFTSAVEGLSDLGRPRDGPDNGPAARPAAYELMGNSRARWRA